MSPSSIRRCDFPKRHSVLSEVIKIVAVSKSFTIRHNRADSLKSKVIGTFHKRYREQKETFWAVKDVSFNVHAGETFANASETAPDIERPLNVSP